MRVWHSPKSTPNPRVEFGGYECLMAFPGNSSGYKPHLPWGWMCIFISKIYHKMMGEEYFKKLASMVKHRNTTISESKIRVFGCYIFRRIPNCQLGGDGIEGSTLAICLLRPFVMFRIFRRKSSKYYDVV